MEDTNAPTPMLRRKSENNRGRGDGDQRDEEDSSEGLSVLVRISFWSVQLRFDEPSILSSCGRRS